MRELPFYHSFGAKAPAVLADLSEKLISMAPVPMSKVFFANSGSEATTPWSSWSGTTTIPAAGRKEKDHLAHQGLSRGHRGLGQPDRPAQQPPGLRPADRRHPAHRLPALLPLRRSRRERRGLRHPLRRQPGENDPRRGPRNGRRLYRRAGDGRGWRHLAAGHLLREDTGGAEEVRRADGRRRGHLRLRAHRQCLGVSDLWHRARYSGYGQGADLCLPADVGGDDHRRHLPGAGRRKREDRRLRPRLYLFRPPGGGGSSSRDPENL